MKMLVFAVLLSIMQAMPPVPRHAPNKTSGSSQAIESDAKTDKSPRPSPSLAVQQSREANTQEGGTNSPSAPNAQQSIVIGQLPAVSVNDVNVKKDWMDKTAWIFGSLLVAVGILGVCAAVKTIRTIEEQTRQIKRQVEVTIRAEQAWIMADMEPQIGANILKSEGSAGKTTTIFVNFTCRNQGKSFAQITEKGYIFKLASVPLPQEPDFGNIDIVQHASEYVAPNEPTEPYKLTPQCAGHRNSLTMLVLYGRVKYWDVYGEHETRFGYQITGMGNLERLPASSYPEYNKHT